MQYLQLPRFFHVRISEAMLLSVHVLQDGHRQKRSYWYTERHEQELHVLLKQLLRDVLFEKRATEVDTKQKGKRTSRSSASRGKKQSVEAEEKKGVGEEEEEEEEQVEEEDPIVENDLEDLKAAVEDNRAVGGGEGDDAARHEERFKSVLSTSRSLEVRRGETIRFTYQFKETQSRYVFLQSNPFFTGEDQHCIEIDEERQSKDSEVVDIDKDVKLNQMGVQVEHITPASQEHLDNSRKRKAEQSNQVIQIDLEEEDEEEKKEKKTTETMEDKKPAEDTRTVVAPSETLTPRPHKRRKNLRSMQIEHVNQTQRYKSFHISPFSLYLYVDQWSKALETKWEKQSISHYLTPLGETGNIKSKGKAAKSKEKQK